MLLSLYVYTILCLYYAGLTRAGQISVASWPCGVYMVEARLSAPLLDEKDIFRVVGHTIGDPTIWMVSDWNRRETSHPGERSEPEASEASVKAATSRLPRAKRGRCSAPA